MNRLDGRLDPARIGGTGAAATYVLTWDGARAGWAAPSGGGGAASTTADFAVFRKIVTVPTSQSSTDVTWAASDQQIVLGLPSWLTIVSGQFHLASGWYSVTVGADCSYVGGPVGLQFNPSFTDVYWSSLEMPLVQKNDTTMGSSLGMTGLQNATGGLAFSLKTQSGTLTTSTSLTINVYITRLGDVT